MIMHSMPAIDERAALAGKLRGQSIKFPSPDNFFPQWSRLVHPELDRLRASIDRRIDEVYFSHPKIAQLKLADFALFGATWWPHTSYERLQIATEFSIWLFVWDDEIDSVVGTFANDLAKADSFRKSTLSFVSKSLGLSCACANACAPDTQPSNAIVNAFESFGYYLRKTCPLDQRKRIAQEIRYFMNKSEIEQRHALSGHVVSFQEYWEFRMGTSAVRVALALNEFTCVISLPKSITIHPDMRLIWDACNAIISTVNDIFSVKKELAEDAVDSVIPIIYAATGNAQDAADISTALVDFYAEDLELAAGHLLNLCEHDEDLLNDLKAFLLGVRCYCTGNLQWSLLTGRYKAATTFTKDAMYITM